MFGLNYKAPHHANSCNLRFVLATYHLVTRSMLNIAVSNNALLNELWDDLSIMNWQAYGR
jgi:hypothetical protein